MTKACSAKEGTRLMLKVNMFGARDELTCLAIETNAFGTGGDRVSNWHQRRSCYTANYAQIYKVKCTPLYNVDVPSGSAR